MAKKGKLETNDRRRLLSERYAVRRAELVAIIKNPEASMEDKFKAQAAIAKLPRNSSKIRVRNRCMLTGRPRGYIRMFNLSRIAFRELALEGVIPGVKKASW